MDKKEKKVLSFPGSIRYITMLNFESPTCLAESNARKKDKKKFQGYNG